MHSSPVINSTCVLFSALSCINTAFYLKLFVATSRCERGAESQRRGCFLYVHELSSMTSREKLSGTGQAAAATASLHDGGCFISCPGRRHFTEGHKPSFDAQSGRSNPLSAVVAHALLELQRQTAAEELKKETGIVNRNSRKTGAV